MKNLSLFLFSIISCLMTACSVSNSGYTPQRKYSEQQLKEDVQVIEQTLKKNDIMMEFSELSSRDKFVDNWTDNTKDRCASHYLTILRQAGLLMEKTDELHPVHLEPYDYEYYIRSGEEWFLDACLLYPYEVKDIKSRLI